MTRNSNNAEDKVSKGSRPTNTRASILKASRGLFLRHGYRKVTMADIAKAAGVTRQCVYSHFNSKKDILTALIEQEGSRVVEAGLRSTSDDQNAVERLASLFASVDGLIREDDFLIGVAGRDPEVLTPDVMRIAFGFEEKVMEVMSGIIRQGTEEGTIRKTDPILMAYMLVRLHEIFFFSPLANLEGYDHESIDAFLVDVVIHLLSPVERKGKRGR